MVRVSVLNLFVNNNGETPNGITTSGKSFNFDVKLEKHSRIFRRKSYASIAEIMPVKIVFVLVRC